MAELALRGFAPAKAAQRRRAGARAEALAAWTLAGPGLILMWLLLLGPAAAVIALSLTDWTFGTPTIAFAGLENYRELLNDAVFWTSLRNTLAYVAFTVPVSVALGLGVALLIEAGASLKGFYRASFFLPVTSTLIAMALVFQFAFHPTAGLVNQALQPRRPADARLAEGPRHCALRARDHRDMAGGRP